MLNIRPATTNDIHTLSSLGRQTFYETYAAENSESDMQHYVSETFSEGQISLELHEPGAFFFIAEYDSIPAGYSKYGGSVAPALEGKACMELERIYILDEFQGKGIGRALVEHAIAFARLQNKEMIWLGVWEKNYNALGFYTRMGFKKAGWKTFTIGSDVQNDYVLVLDVGRTDYSS